MRSALIVALPLVACASALGCAMLFPQAGGPVQAPINAKTPRLVANLGMDYHEVRRRSSVDLGRGIYADQRGGTRKHTFVKEVYEEDKQREAFDWELAGTGIVFGRCRYFWIDTGDNDDPRLNFISVTTAPDSMTWDRLTRSLHTIVKRLKKAGFRPLRFRDGDTSDDVLETMLQDYPKTKADDVSQSVGGVDYVRGNVLLTLKARRLSYPKPGETAISGDDFIHIVELHPFSEWMKDAKDDGITVAAP